MKKLNLKQWMFLLMSLSVILYSCDDDDNNDKPEAYDNGVFIANEGNMTAGNGSVSFYSYDADSVSNYVFKTVNNRDLGTFVQNVSIHDDYVYIVVNGSNKVEIADAGTMIEAGVINDLDGPRYFLGVNDNKGYVSQWGNNGEVKVIDLTTFTVTKTIATGAGSEKMILHNNKVYVANSGGFVSNNTISVINTTSDEVEETITLNGDCPMDFAIDANDDLWVLCAGYYDWMNNTHTPSKLEKINPTSNEIVATLTISETTHPTGLEVSRNGNNLFYGGGYGFSGIYKMSITDASVPTSPLVDKDFYGFNINPETGNIFAFDATNFSDNGVLYRYEPNGTLLKSYEVGVGPNGADVHKK